MVLAANEADAAAAIAAPRQALAIEEALPSMPPVVHARIDAERQVKVA
jgi:hypothetical protein